VGFTLVIGREDDLCCRLVRDRLEIAGKQFVFLPENELFPGLNFQWELRKGKSHGSLGYGSPSASEPIPFDQIDGVLARFSGITTSPEEHQTKDGQYLNAEWHALARGYMHSLPCAVVNRLRPELWYKMRLTVPDMMALVPGMRFQLPRTTVTTRFADARAFFEQCQPGMNYSPLSMPSRYPIEGTRQLEKLEPLSGFLPLCLTEIVPGDVVQAFVVGSEVIFDGPAHDAAAHRLAADCCREAAAALGLTFCEFELVKTPDDTWYCFGIHCMPHLFGCTPETRTAIINQLLVSLGAGAQRRAA
jgi:hypothetical protein